jgi:hypothetical protein
VGGAAAAGARRIWMEPGIAAEIIPNPATSSRREKIFNCAMKAARAEVVRLTGVAI